ncbi:hypothetical protein Pd630_LPD16151 (plasmid) [Rhodococcus opacus PD630]|nr:hypothetical protein Pd630_LPD16151 [Rhodococcus opacus PD630]
MFAVTPDCHPVPELGGRLGQKCVEIHVRNFLMSADRVDG